MNTAPRDTVSQDTTVLSTMDNGLIEANVISQEDCLTHWVITLSQSGECINADLDLSKIRMHYSQHPLPQVISSIGFRIKNDKPPVHTLLGDLWRPPELMELPGGLLRLR